jgi:adenylylsulfate reductase subunit B
MWTIKFSSGLTKRFKFPIRTTVEGQVDPYAGKPAPDWGTLKSPGLFNKPATTE